MRFVDHELRPSIRTRIRTSCPDTWSEAGKSAVSGHESGHQVRIEGLGHDSREYPDTNRPISGESTPNPDKNPDKVSGFIARPVGARVIPTKSRAQLRDDHHHHDEQQHSSLMIWWGLLTAVQIVHHDRQRDMIESLVIVSATVTRTRANKQGAREA